jgi:carbonic anhydrase
MREVYGGTTCFSGARVDQTDVVVNLDAFLDNNRTWVNERFAGSQPVHPDRKLAVVACMDSRMPIFQMLGLASGDAHIIRNAGGVITDDVIRSLMISQRLLGTVGVLLIHHTDCGLTRISEDQLRAELEAETGLRPSFSVDEAAHGFAVHPPQGRHPRPGLRRRHRRPPPRPPRAGLHRELRAQA